MEIIAIAFTILTCALHGYFFILETYLWTTPFGLKVFKMQKEAAQSSQVLAANQGVYNGMLALGLLITFFLPDMTSAMAIRRYCLCFIILVGCYGWYSLKNIKIFAIQSVPAIIALAANEAA